MVTIASRMMAPSRWGSGHLSSTIGTALPGRARYGPSARLLGRLARADRGAYI